MTDRYNPPTRVHSIEVPWKALVLRADPDFERELRNEVEYEFPHRTFTANRAKRGAYAD